MTEHEESAAKKAEAVLDELVAFKGGQRRDPQVRLARGMAMHQENGTPLIVSAPTGVGKSYAGFAASLASGKKTLIATHTIALQQQLLRDGKMLSEARGDFDVALLKGRGAYLCKLRQSQVLSKNEYKDNPELEKVIDWADQTDTGEKSELDFSVSQETWSKVSVSADQCIGKQCPFAKQCFAEFARAKAKKADITILNHALLAQGMRQENFMDGEFENVVVDECHEFPQVVGEAFGATVTSGRLSWAKRQARRWASVEENRAFDRAMTNIMNAVRKAGHENVRHLDRHPVRDNLYKIESLVGEWMKRLEGEKNYITKQSFFTLINDIDLIALGETRRQTAWIEKNGDDGFRMRSVLFDASKVIKENLLDTYKSVEFMSATVKVGKNFDYMARRLGVSKTDEWQAAEVPHVFDYKNNGMIWFPERMKRPNDEGYPMQVANIAKFCVKKANGRTLVLCTSWRNVNIIGEHLRKSFAKEEFPVIMQRPGVDLKRMAEEFDANPKAVLVGTRSLWTGMSFEGDTCQCVIIDKIPFPTPSDPIVKAEMESCNDSGMSDFAAMNAVMVPRAILPITQGVGRGIRTMTDKALIVLPDPRLNKKSRFYTPSYAGQILTPLPPMPVETETQKAVEFLTRISQEDSSS